jgi:hypothetical protein
MSSVANVEKWVEQRVGSAGGARRLIARYPRLMLPAPPSGATAETRLGEPLGLSDAALAQLSTAYGFTDLARRFPSRGDIRDLRRVAWYGSALADIGCRPGTAGRADVLRTGALFNVAVALADTVVDDYPETLRRAQGVPHPAALERRLFQPLDRQAALTSPDPALRGIARLFDCALSSLGQRYALDPATLRVLAGQLAGMYESEVGHGADRMPAKTLPTIFITTSAAGAGDLATKRLAERLARLLARLDDWTDLGRDICRLRANGFVLPHHGRGRHLLSYTRRALYRVLGGRRSHAEIGWMLADACKATLEAATAAGPDAHAKTCALLWRMVGAV